MSDAPDVEASRDAYERAVQRYHEARRHGTRSQEWQAASEADRARLEYYKARDARQLSPMTDRIVLPRAPEQFTAAIRGAPRTRRSIVSLAFSVVMPFLLFLGVALPLLVYALAPR